MITVPKSFNEDFALVIAHYKEDETEWKQWCRENIAEAIDKFSVWAERIRSNEY